MAPVTKGQPLPGVTGAQRPRPSATGVRRGRGRSSLLLPGGFGCHLDGPSAEPLPPVPGQLPGPPVQTALGPGLPSAARLPLRPASPSWVPLAAPPPRGRLGRQASGPRHSPRWGCRLLARPHAGQPPGPHSLGGGNPEIESPRPPRAAASVPARQPARQPQPAPLTTHPASCTCSWSHDTWIPCPHTLLG